MSPFDIFESRILFFSIIKTAHKSLQKPISVCMALVWTLVQPMAPRSCSCRSCNHHSSSAETSEVESLGIFLELRIKFAILPDIHGCSPPKETLWPHGTSKTWGFHKALYLYLNTLFYSILSTYKVCSSSPGFPT